MSSVRDKPKCKGWSEPLHSTSLSGTRPFSDDHVENFARRSTSEGLQSSNHSRTESKRSSSGQLETDPQSPEEISFSDEPHFWCNGFGNKHTRRIWSDEHHQMTQETPLYNEKVAVWCGFWDQGVIRKTKAKRTLLLVVPGFNLSTTIPA